MSDVDLPLFRSKFLHACAQYLMSDLGIKDVIPFAKPRNELFVISPLLQREGPLPYYHRNLGGWGFDGSNDFDGGIMIDVRDSGSVTLRSPDGEFGYITTQIETPEDLGNR